MKNTLKYLVSELVDHKDDVKIDEQTVGETIVLTIHVHADDMGKIIGKSGRIIRAVRDLIKILAAKHNQYVDVVIAQETPQAAS